MVAGLLLLGSASRADAFEWITDYEKGLDEARERNAPMFIFFCQNT